jgi:hypothetical protein
VDFEQITTIVSVLISTILGGGGLVALLKARSEIRNNNKTNDVANLRETIETIQGANSELQKQYKEALIENDLRTTRLSERLQYIEIEYVKQSQQNADNLKRIANLEIDLRKANEEIVVLKEEIKRKNIDLMRLEQENIELRKQQTKLSLIP